MDGWMAGAGRGPRAEGSQGGVVRAGNVPVAGAASSLHVPETQH